MRTGDELSIFSATQIRPANKRVPVERLHPHVGIGAMKPIYKRHSDWQDLPFTALAEVADFAEAMSAVAQELGAEAPCCIAIECEDRAYTKLTPREIRTLSLELPLQAVTHLVLYTTGMEDEPVAFRLTVNREHENSVSSTRLEIRGTSLGAVEGANVRGKQEIERRFAKWRAAKEGTNNEGSREAGPAWKRVLNHPWAIQIGGGVAAAVIGAGLLLLLHWP